jgi:ankyrin repeat protein
MLIDCGAALNVTDGNGYTPLHLACRQGHGSVAVILIDGGAALNGTDGDGRTPLHLACSAGHGSVAVILIDRGAHPNVADKRGWTPLHVACGAVERKEKRKTLLEIIRELILAGADTQARDSKGRLPVKLLRANDRRSRAILREAVEEMESGALKPVLK